MNKTTKVFGVAVMMMCSTPAWAVSTGAATRPGIRIKALDAGLAVAAGMLKDQVAANPIKDTPVGAVDGTVAGVQFSVDDVRLDASVATLALTSHERGLSLVAGLEDVKIAMPVMNVTTRILGRLVSGQCFGAAVYWGRSAPVPLTIEVSAAVEDKAIKLSPVTVRHPVNPLNYGIVAPTHCDAPMNSGAAMRLSVIGALQSASPFVEPTLRRRFAAILPAAGEALTTALSPSFPFSIAGVPGLPQSEASLDVFPLAIEPADGVLTVIGGVELTVESNEAKRSTAAALAIPLAAVGINPGILTDAFASLFPNGTDYIEIDEDTAPGLHEVLDVRSAASIWPDLQQIPLSKPYLRLWVRVAEAPLLGTDAATQRVTASVPRIEMKFMIQQDGMWRDYFVMNVALGAAVTTSFVDDSLSLQLAAGSSVAVTGRWADGYTPQIDLFEYDVAEFLFSTVFDYLGAAGPLASIWVPTMVVGDRDVTLANPVVDESFLNLDVVDVTPDRD